MDILDIQVTSEIPGELVGAHEVEIFAIASVNGQPWPNVVNIDVFFEALTQSGRLPLFTCGCGVFGCGGYYVDVTHTPDAWVWRNRYTPSGSAAGALLLDAYEARFLWEDVYAVASSLLAALRALHGDHLIDRLVVGVAGADITGRLPHYQAQLQRGAPRGGPESAARR